MEALRGSSPSSDKKAYLGQMTFKGGKVDITSSQRSYLPRASLYIGIVGAVNFTVFALFYLQDWTHRFSFMAALIPIPFISLLLAWKKLFLGGVLLVALGVAALLIDINLSIGIVGQIAGVGSGHTVILVYTIVFVTLPLIVSGILFLLSARTRGKSIDRKKV